MQRTVTLPAGGDVAVSAVAGAAVGAAAWGALVGTDALQGGPVLCLFRVATGWPCPFCGLTRGLAALGDGQFTAAFTLSPLTFLVLPLAVALVFMVARARVRRQRVTFPQPALWAASVVVAASWLFQLLRGAT